MKVNRLSTGYQMSVPFKDLERACASSRLETCKNSFRVSEFYTQELKSMRGNKCTFFEGLWCLFTGLAAMRLMVSFPSRLKYTERREVRKQPSNPAKAASKGFSF